MSSPQPIMTANDLVCAVTEITMQSAHPVATGDEVYAWLMANNIDWGENITPRGRHFWKADHANAPFVLRKFKIEPLTHTGANAWCLARRWIDACAWTAHQSPRWRAIPWDVTKKNWIWRCAERVDANVEPVSVFDVHALVRCKAAAQDVVADEDVE